MMDFCFSTPSTTVAAGRALVLGALATQFAGVGFGPYIPPNPASFDFLHIEIPGTVFSAALPAPYRAAANLDRLVIDTADGLTVRPDPNPLLPGTVTGYWFNLLIALRYNDDKLPALLNQFRGFLVSRWIGQADTTRVATAAELALDPGRPGLAWKLRDSVQLWDGNIRVRKAVFLGAP